MIINGTFNENSSTFIYSGTGPTNITGTTYFNLTLDHVGTIFNSAGGTTITNIFELTSGIFDAADKTIILEGVGAPFVINGSFIGSSSTVRYTGDGNTLITAVDYNNLETKASGMGRTYTFSSGTINIEGDYTNGDGVNDLITTANSNDPILNINGDFINNANATFVSSNSAAFSVASNYINYNAAAFIHSNGSLAFDGQGVQNIISNTDPFYNLISTNASAGGVVFSDGITVANLLTCITANSTLTFTAGTTSNINDINLNGQNTSSRVTIASTAALSALWIVSANPQTAVSNVAVSYNDASGGETIDASDGTNYESVYGSTSNWDFGSVPTPTSLVISNKNPQINKNNQYVFTATVYDNLGNPMTNVIISWAVVNGGGGIDQSGRFTAGDIAGLFINTVEASAYSLNDYSDVIITDTTPQNPPEDPDDPDNPGGGNVNPGGTGTISTGGASSTTTVLADNPTGGSETPGSSDTPVSTSTVNYDNPTIASDIPIIGPLLQNPLVQSILSHTVNGALDVSNEAESNPATLPIIWAGIIISIASIVSSFYSLLFLQINIREYVLLILNFLATLFDNRKKERWGLVYDQGTKKPIEGAVVSLYRFDIMRLVSVAVTDKHGRYYFTVKEGNYVLSVKKLGYIFPSIAAKSEHQYDRDIYFGQQMQIKEKSAIINALVPLDPTAKSISKISLFAVLLLSTTIRLTILLSGTSLAIILYIYHPHVVNLLTLLAYLIVWLIEFLVQYRNLRFCLVYDKKLHKPVDLALVRVINGENKIVQTIVSDISGKFLANMPIGGGYLTIDRADYESLKTIVFPEGFIEGKKFYLKSNDKTINNFQLRN